jgi:hypothetical protein
VSEPLDLYRVSWSERVQRRLAELAGEAARGGDQEAFAASLKEFDRRPHVYPQFGDPLRNLTFEKATLYNGILRPLAMRYAVYEDQRVVVVVGLPVLLPTATTQPDAET